MFDKGQAMLFWALECPAEMIPEWNEWYNKEHIIAGLMQTPGFISFNRYEKEMEAPLDSLTPIPSMPKYLSYYELYDEHVLESEAYHINRWSKGPGMRPEWTKRMLTFVSQIIGGTYRPLSDTWFAGSERSSDRIWVAYFQPVAGQENEADAWYNEELLPAIKKIDLIRACRLYGALDESPDVNKAKVSLTEKPKRIVLTTVSKNADPAKALKDTWPSAKGMINGAISVIYQRMPL